MPTDDETKFKGPSTWGAATRLLVTKGEKNLTDEDIFGDELAPKKKGALDYLGHFANDSVADEGHNIGKGKLGIRRIGQGAHIGRGFRQIPGNAASGYIDKKARVAMDAIDSKLGGMVAGGPIGAPTKMPLRKATRIAKMKAPTPKGPLHLKP